MPTARSLCRVAPLARHAAARRAFSASPRSLAEEVRIMEVGPRDGLQNEKATIPLDTKLELIRRLAQTGLKDLEAGSFVAPKWVPQMASSADIYKSLLANPPQAKHQMAYNFLVPNLKGLENMLKISSTPAEAPPTPPPSPKSSEFPAPNTSSADANAVPTDPLASSAPTGPFTAEVSLFAAATEAFSKANTNCTIAESLERCRPIVARAKEQNIRVRGYVSVALGCPYEGPDTDPQVVADITRTLLEMGAYEVSVADTTGMGTAPRTRKLLEALSAAGISNRDLALHFHDTYGQALVNTVVGLEHGVRTFDSSVGGLGGCPYSKGATGNVSTEDLVYTLHSLGVRTGIDVAKMAEIGAWITREVGKPNESRAGKALLARLKG